MDYKALADKMLPEITKTPEYYLEKYPERDLKEGARVTRFAPSPTGFQHIGGVFAALVSERLAKQSGGVFILRIEDTDQKREVKGAIQDTINTMHNFDIRFDEGMTGEYTEKGPYGPYKQSERGEIYKTFAKSLIERNLAYPCFCSAEELNEIREKQTAIKETPGYYGKWAKCRNLTPDEAAARIDKGEKFVIRLKSPGNAEHKVHFHDYVKGDVSFPENVQDVVIIKSDGLPTYHFAHAVDDTLMRVTHITRGEEWLSSLPIHVQLFEVLGFKLPKYCHIPTMMKMDGESKRKLSKRKDPESAVSYYKEEGYPNVSVLEYLLNIINSNFEDWRAENPDLPYTDFPVAIEKMSKSGALFDIIKLQDVSKNVIAKMKADKVYELYTAWAEEYDKEMYGLMVKYADRAKEMFNIDKEGPKPRKDFAKWNEVRDKVFYFFDELFYAEPKENIELPGRIDLDECKSLIREYKEVFDISGDQSQWFEGLKAFASEHGYTSNRKEFKKNPEAYKGMVADVAAAVRSAVTHRGNTPDLYTIMKILGKDNVKARFEKFLEL